MKFLQFVFVVLLGAVIISEGYGCPNPTTDCNCNFSPICACDGYTTMRFINKCYMDAENCRRRFSNAPPFYLRNYNECKQVNGGNGCNTVCPFIFSPICAVSYRGFETFGNDCLLGIANCQQGNIWRYIGEGNCTLYQ